jgi:hypothetical protein
MNGTTNARIARRHHSCIRVEFVDGNAPPTRNVYWTSRAARLGSMAMLDPIGVRVEEGARYDNKSIGLIEPDAAKSDFASQAVRSDKTTPRLEVHLTAQQLHLLTAQELPSLEGLVLQAVCF